MAGDRARSVRIYIRRRKAQIRRESGNPEAAIDALMRQLPQPTRAEGAQRPTRRATPPRRPTG